MRKFKLLRDLPALKADAIFREVTIDRYCSDTLGQSAYCFTLKAILANPDFFEEVKEEIKESKFIVSFSENIFSISKSDEQNFTIEELDILANTFNPGLFKKIRGKNKIENVSGRDFTEDELNTVDDALNGELFSEDEIKRALSEVYFETMEGLSRDKFCEKLFEEIQFYRDNKNEIN